MDSRFNVEDLEEKLKDHMWRLDNLYYVRDKAGRKVRFKMNSTQRFVAENLWYLNIITKARQLGMTTFFAIFYLDQVLFSENKIAGIIAHKQEDMKKIFRGKILFAYKNLDPEIKKLVGEPVIQSASEITFENGGEIFVSLSTRGGTVNFLHISEFGYICRHDPLKAEEIVNGAINSVHAGQMISIESTAEGRSGYFYDFVQMAENKRKLGKKLTPLDFKSFFFPWYLDPEYTIEGQEHYYLDQEDVEYFNKLEELTNVKLTHGQKVWYVKKKEVLARQDITKLYTQFPSTIDEAFMASLEDAYYARLVGRVYLEKRFGFFPIDPRAEVNVAWDLGMNDKTVMIFFQELGEEIRIIDHYANNNEGLEHYSRVLADKGYKYGRHYLPHDAAVRDLSTGISREQFMWDLGIRNTMVAPKASIQDGIEKVRQIFHRCRFNESKTQALLDSLQNYKKDKSKVTGEAMNSPRHDQYSHDADAFRVLAMAIGTYGVSSSMPDVHIESFVV
jgi:hypothetical protein